MCKVISVANQKGGVGKTTTTMNLGIGLARTGRKVLMIDSDPQGDLTICMGYRNPDELDYTLSNILGYLIEEEPFDPREGIIHHDEGADFVPSNIDLSGIESSLNATDLLGRENVLSDYLEMVKEDYDYIIIDCSPSIGMVTINALVAADSVLIPVEAEYLPAKGLEQLIRTINKVQKKLNRKLKIEGVLMTLVDERTNLCKGIMDFINEVYEQRIRIFQSRIPRSVRAAEIAAVGNSLFEYDPEGKAAKAYLLKELSMYGLIERKKRGLGKPDIIYVKDFLHALDDESRVDGMQDFRKTELRTPEGTQEFQNTEFKTSEKRNSGLPENESPDFWEAETSNTDKNYSEFNQTDRSQVLKPLQNHNNKLADDDETRASVNPIKESLIKA